jgi:hypothetical protein
MPSITIPTVIAGVGAVGSVAGGIMNSNATKSAANTEAAAATHAADVQAQIARENATNLTAAGQQGAGIYGAAAPQAAGIYGNASTLAQQLQAQAQQQAYGTQLGIYGNTASALSPFMNIGQGAMSQLGRILGIGSGTNGPDNSALFSALSNSPGYQFSLQQGLNAVNQSGAARGLLNSGATIKNATQYGQGLAQSTLGTYLQNLFSLGQSGQNAAGTLGQIGSNTGSQLGVTLLNGANGQANSLLAGAQGQAGSILTGAQGQSDSLLRGAGGAANALYSGTAGQADSLLQGGNAAGSGILGSSMALTGGLNQGLNNSMLAYQLSQQNGGYTYPGGQVSGSFNDTPLNWVP